MTLRNKTLRIIAVTTVGLVIALYATSQLIVLSSFARQEEEQTRQNMERVAGTLEDNLSTLRGTTIDWAAWDDTYAYMADHNDAYYRSNLALNTPMSSNRLSLMLFVDKEGKTVYARGYDLLSSADSPVPEGIQTHLSPDGPLLEPARTAEGISGILSLPEGPLLVAAEPIVTSDQTGPPRGTLIFGRFLDTAEIGRLSRITLFSLTAHQVGTEGMPPDFKTASETIARTGSAFVSPLDDRTISGYELLDDIYGTPALVLRAEMPRSVYEKGRSILIYFVVALAVVGAVFALVTLVLLERLVLSRLARVGLGVSRIAVTRELSAYLPVDGGDELSQLSADINGMLRAIDDSQQERWKSEERFRAVFEYALDPITILDDEGKIVEANAAAAALYGVEKEELMGHAVFGLLRSDQVEASLHQWQTLMQEGHIQGDFELQRADGEIRQIEYHAQANFLPHYHLTVIRDVTERKRLEAKLAHQAFHDSLTNLPNRALFMDRLGHALARAGRHAESVAVLFLDLDEFKVINDSLGHKVGDRLLIAVAERLLRCVRPGDTVARLGGDEFTVLIEGLRSPNEATAAGERITARLQAPFELDGHEVFVSTSIGIALSASGQDRPDNLLRNADLAMYEAKKGGKNRAALFEPEMNSRAWERLAVETDLRRAVDRGEFSIYYQPIVQLCTGKVMEVEALVRWEHPQRGIVSPSEFIPLAEETGMILTIGHWVLEQACKQVREWQLQYPDDDPLLLSVNLSPKQFCQPRLVGKIAGVLRDTGLDPACLKLEITEGVALDSTEDTLNTLKLLKKLGLKLAIDDFGTGYSGLSYLKRYPVDTLKLDRAFIKGLGTDHEDTAIVHAVIAFAKALDLNVIAEGIETADQLHQLQQLGCDAGQGYYFSRPFSPADAAPIISTRQARTKSPNSTTKQSKPVSLPPVKITQNSKLKTQN